MKEKAEVLREGAQFLQAVLAPHGFSFEMRGTGSSSGGTFAWGEFVRGDRRLELHFRGSLGMARYHIADHSAAHEAYMREIGAWEGCRYPGFSDDPMDAFRNLAHDSISRRRLRAAATATHSQISVLTITPQFFGWIESAGVDMLSGSLTDRPATSANLTTQWLGTHCANL